jgi:hypothetical protein
MAGLLRVTGKREAVFFAVPLFGAAMVLATAHLGARVRSRHLGAAAAVLLLTSPSFLLQLTQPVSDVPAATWWTVCLVLALSNTTWSAVLAGAAAAMAVLTRPNLVPLAAVIGAFYVWRVAHTDSAQRRDAIVRTAVFCAMVLPGCLIVAALNTYWYGSPFSSGYAAFNELYQWKHVALNLDRYPRWLVQTQTPFIYLGFAAPFVAEGKERVWLLLAFAAVVVLSYIPYGYFGYQEWVYLRFLLPAYPALLVSSLVVSAVLIGRALPREHTVTIVATTFLVALAAWQAWTSRRLSVLDLRVIEERYVKVGRYIDKSMSSDSVFIAGLHSGSIRYYSGKQTINFDRLHPRALGDAVRSLSAMGRRPFIVIEEGEEPRFRWQFETDTPIGKLDWPPSLETYHGPRVRIYDPAERERFVAGQPVITYDIDFIEKPVVTQK